VEVRRGMGLSLSELRGDLPEGGLFGGGAWRWSPEPLKLGKAEALIDWSKSAQDLDRHIRAFNPFPGAQARLGGQTVKLWHAVPVGGSGENGRILSVDRNSIVVACGEGALAVSELQKAGGKRLAVREFLAGHALKAGDRFDVAA